MNSLVNHYFPIGQQSEHAPTATCVCSPEDTGGGRSYIHRRAYEFGWTYPCCGAVGEGRAYGKRGGGPPGQDVMGPYIDALPHNCAAEDETS